MKIKYDSILIIALLTLSMSQSGFTEQLHDEHNHEHSSEQHNHEHEASEETNHEDHEHEEEGGLRFSAEELKEFSITTQAAGPGEIHKTLDLTGEVIVAPERLYHVVPRVSGVIRKIYKHLGDPVKTGDLLAVLSSRELADAKAQFVAADSLLKLANSNLARERKLYKNKISSQRNYFTARQTQAEMAIKRKAAKQRLQALGLSDDKIEQLLNQHEQDLTRYELKSPADGLIIDKHATHGELLNTTTRSFTIADLSKVWVNLTVYQKDLPIVHKGQQAFIATRFGTPDQELNAVSTIDWISPVLNEKTRSATARVILDNPDNNWRPGLFVSAKVTLSQTHADIVIPLSALQTLEGQTVVFVQHEPGEFEPQAVVTGKRDFKFVEIIRGLKKGQIYVSNHAFALKAQMQKGEFGHGHSH